MDLIARSTIRSALFLSALSLATFFFGLGSLPFVGADDDEKTGIEIVRRALEEPIRIIVQNAGAEGAIVVGKVKESAKLNFGYNAQTDEYEDLVAAGVIDPTKVTRTALQNAASIAGLMITTECVVAEKPETEKPAAGAPPGMGGMY